jgi:hypothetical protein
MSKLFLYIVMSLSAICFRPSLSYAQNDVNALQRVIAIQNARIAQLEQRLEVLLQNGLTVNNKNIVNPQGKWVGDPTGLQGPQGPQGRDGIFSLKPIRSAAGQSCDAKCNEEGNGGRCLTAWHGNGYSSSTVGCGYTKSDRTYKCLCY